MPMIHNAFHSVQVGRKSYVYRTSEEEIKLISRKNSCTTLSSVRLITTASDSYTNETDSYNVDV